MRTEEPRAIRLSEYRAPDYRITDIAIDFILDPDATRVIARSTVTRSGQSVPLVLNGEHLKLLSVSIDGKVLSAGNYTVDEQTLTLPNVPQTFLLEVVTEIAPAKNTALEGLYLSKGVFCTQCEAEGFRRITYFLDRPDVLAVYTTRIEAAKDRYPVLLSNGNLCESGDLAGGKHYAVWKDPFPKPCYLFALVGGNLGVLEDRFITMSGRSVALKIFVEHGNEQKVTYAMDALKRAMKWDEEKYGREYDLDIFMIVAVSAFNFGAMENKGLNIFNDKLLLASPETATDDDYARIESVVAHEYFHNWTGDRITCRDWFQLSLKEGLTVFRDQSFSADQRSAGVKRIEDVRILRMRQFQEDAGPLAHPVQPQSYITIDNFYTATVYEKGAEVIRMLKTLVGEEGYRKTTDLYFARHDGQAATVEDWVRCFEDACGRDLKQFRLWYAQSGTPTVTVEGAYDAQRKTYALRLAQSLAPTPGQPTKEPMLIPVTVSLLGPQGPLPLTLEGENAKGPEERVIELTGPEQTFVFTGVEETPLLSVGRGFSAPVHFKTSADRRTRADLMRRDTDDFNRWEAAQSLAREIVIEMSKTAASGGAPKGDPIFVDALGDVLAFADRDPAFVANMLSLPTENEIALAVKEPDPEAIHAARLALVRHISARHRDSFEALYRQHDPAHEGALDAESASRRALRNICLRFLTATNDEDAASLADAHYRNARNMTDMIAGLAALTQMNSVRRDRALAHFYDRFSNDPLVLDKWFSLQAGSSLPGTLGAVRALMKHPAFDIKNPNRVRALIGAFSANHLRFHAQDGSGYVLLGETIRALDKINPQLAARSAGCFESWRRYDPGRQLLMRRELESMKQMEGLSSNLFEVAEKMLSG
jgi:aminopeptidase N